MENPGRTRTPSRRKKQALRSRSVNTPSRLTPGGALTKAAAAAGQQRRAFELQIARLHDEKAALAEKVASLRADAAELSVTRAAEAEAGALRAEASGELASLRISNELLREERLEIAAVSEAAEARAATLSAELEALRAAGTGAAEQELLNAVDVAEARAVAALAERDGAALREGERATALVALAEQLDEQRARAQNAEDEKVMLYTKHKAQLAAAAQSFAAQGYETRLATLAAENAALRAQLTPALALAGAAQTNAGLVEECQRMFAMLERTSAVSSSSAASVERAAAVATAAATASPAAEAAATAAATAVTTEWRAKCAALEDTIASLEVQQTLDRAMGVVEAAARGEAQIHAAEMARDEALARCASLGERDASRDEERDAMVEFHTMELTCVRGEAAALTASIATQRIAVDTMRAACAATCAGERADCAARDAELALLFAAAVDAERAATTEGKDSADANAALQARVDELSERFVKSRTKSLERKAQLAAATEQLDAMGVEMAALRRREETAAAAAAACQSAAAELESATARVAAVEGEKVQLLAQLDRLCDMLESEVASDARLAAIQGAARTSMRLQRELSDAQAKITAQRQYILLFKERHDAKVAHLRQQQQQQQ